MPLRQTATQKTITVKLTQQHVEQLAELEQSLNDTQSNIMRRALDIYYFIRNTDSSIFNKLKNKLKKS